MLLEERKRKRAERERFKVKEVEGRYRREAEWRKDAGISLRWSRKDTGRREHPKVPLYLYVLTCVYSYITPRRPRQSSRAVINVERMAGKPYLMHEANMMK